MAAVDRNSDGSYDAVDSGGFGKDYHGQDAFGERIGGTGIGGNHFGGFEEGHFGVGDGKPHFEREATSYGDIAQTETMDKPDTGSLFDSSNESKAECMKDSLRDLNSGTSEEDSNTGSMDTSFQIGGTEDEERTKAKAELYRRERELNEAERRREAMGEFIDRKTAEFAKEAKEVENMGFLDKTKDTVFGGKRSNLRQKIESFATANGVELDDKIRMGMTTAGKEREAIKAALEKISKESKSKLQSNLDAAQMAYDTAKAEYDKLESSFTDKMKEDKPKETNMSKATPGKSDYETKANKDSTKEVPKETPSRNDFGNHAVDTLKEATDRIADSFTAKSLGLKSVEDFARENGYNPEKLSTMKAYQSYQNKEIMKAIPKVVKNVGGYIVERIKDAFDPSQLPERIRNTLARYNAATLVGAAILSINSGAGLQASIDQALTMVDPEDQTAVSDFLEDILKDRDTVKDLSNAIDGALAPEENSNASELDEEIVNIGRKNNTDYDDFNAGLGSSSDADVKVFIARNIKADPILRRMVEKLGK